MKVGLASVRIRLVAVLPPSRRRLLRCRSAAAVRCSQVFGSAELGFPGAGGGAVASSVQWIFVSRPPPRCGFSFSGVAARAVELVVLVEVLCRWWLLCWLKEGVGGPEAGLWSAGEGSACLRCGRPDPEQEELGALRRLIRLHRQDPPRRRWCFLQLINAMWLGVLLLRRCGVVGVLLLVVDLFLFASRVCAFLCVVCVLPCSSI